MTPKSDDADSDPAASPITDRRQIRGAERRAAILVAATSRFARYGYDNTRLRDVARDAGMTDAGLLHHFRTKEDLFTAVMALREEVYAGVAVGPEVTVRELFDSLVESIERAHPDLLRFNAMLTGSSMLVEHPGHGVSTDQLGRALDAIVPIVRRAMERGEIRPGVDPVQLTLEVAALSEGVRDQWLALPDVVDYARVLRAALDARYEAIRLDP